jgi:hypothetical protein
VALTAYRGECSNFFPPRFTNRPSGEKQESTAGVTLLPAVVNPERKAKAASDFRFFCESYFPLTFHLPWSRDHLKVIAKIEQAVLRGGLFAMAMPRGSGKTSICECACIWAVLYCHREFVCLIGSDEGHAMDMLDAIKMELDGNDLLLEDFPEVVYPIQCLDGIANRCAGQLYKGERTHIGWTAREIVLPTIPGSKASGAIIKVAGITGRIRGMKYKRADGRTVRPTLVVFDERDSRVERVQFGWEKGKSGRRNYTALRRRGTLSHELPETNHAPPSTAAPGSQSCQHSAGPRSQERGTARITTPGVRRLSGDAGRMACGHGLQPQPYRWQAAQSR